MRGVVRARSAVVGKVLGIADSLIETYRPAPDAVVDADLAALRRMDSKTLANEIRKGAAPVAASGRALRDRESIKRDLVEGRRLS